MNIWRSRNSPGIVRSEYKLNVGVAYASDGVLLHGAGPRVYGYYRNIVVRARSEVEAIEIACKYVDDGRVQVGRIETLQVTPGAQGESGVVGIGPRIYYEEQPRE